MKNKFAIRLKKTGEFLSTRGTYRRKFGHIDNAQLWTNIGHAKLALYHIPEVKKWMKDTKYGWANPNAKDFPIEIVEFNVILIDAKKGYIG